MRISRVVASSVAASLALAGCTKPPPPSPPKVMGGGVEPIANCASTVPKPVAGETYVITLGSTFELRDAQAGKSGHAPPSHPTPPKTRLDISTDLQAGQAGTIKIVLTDPTLTFQAPDLALRGGDADAPKIFCSVVYSPGGRELSFTVHREIGGPTSASYNLGLIVKDKQNSSYALPIFIDPSVDNNG